jgi:arylsulfatase A-like enzyme
VDVSDALLGKDKKGRAHIVEHARALSYREGDWKMIELNKGPRVNPGPKTELGTGDAAQLYNVAKDRGETVDLAAREPERLKAMQAALEKIRASGRSR